MHGLPIEVRAAEAVHARLAELIGTETRIAESVAGWGDVVRDQPDVSDAIDVMQRTARAQRAAVERRLEALGGAGPRGDPHPGPQLEPGSIVATPRSASEALQRSAVLAVDAALAYETAYQTARLAYDGETCDLAEVHLTAYATAAAGARRLLPHVVARELRAAGFTCACGCPMCSIGACGCVRATLVTAEEGWGGQYPREDGLALLIPPRPGSQLADAGLDQGDRIVSVDGTSIGSNPEMQAALRRHEIGEPARLEVERRTGERLELAVTRIA